MSDYDEFVSPRAEKRRVGPQDVMIKIEVPSRQIGKVIGKEGCRIRRIRKETGAMIKIADAVAVSTDVPQVLKALEEIGCMLRENPPKRGISIRPSYSCTLTSSIASNLPVPSAEYVTSEMIMEKLAGVMIGKNG